MDVLDKCFERSRGFAASIADDALRMKGTGELSSQVVSDSMGGMSALQDQAKHKNRYGLFRGWVYSAINALSMKGAGQPIRVGRRAGIEANPDERSSVVSRKAFLMNKMPPSTRTKAMEGEMELLVDHPVVTALDNPNQYQDRWQFTYTAIANLNLTGWAYIVHEETEYGMKLYSLPTTWVTPVGTAEEGLYSKYRIRNPKKVEDQGSLIDAKHVIAAHLPDPQDILSGVSPSSSQIESLKIDDSIQTSQARFFRNGIFPGVVVTVGKEPHPDVPAGTRPRLTAPQRRHVYAAIRNAMGGIENYGNPAIVDGLIEKIEPLSMTQNEMGWDKSEEKVKQRILSAFAVNPLILGEKAPSSYAQASVVTQLFYDRVNTFLELIGYVIQELVNRTTSEMLVVWYEMAEAVDPKIESEMLKTGRINGDVSRNEYRAKLGYPPVVDEEAASRSILLDTVGGMTGTGSLLNQYAQGSITQKALSYLLSLFLQIPQEDLINGLGEAPEVINQRPTQLLQQIIEEMKKPVRVITKTVSDVGEKQ